MPPTPKWPKGVCRECGSDALDGPWRGQFYCNTCGKTQEKPRVEEDSQPDVRPTSHPPNRGD